MPPKERIIIHFILSQSVRAAIIKIPQTEQLINSKNLLLTILEAGNFKSKAPAWSCSRTSSGSELGFSHCSEEGARKLCGVSSTLVT